jgi:membrane protease YdiL (CAAX protease family)
MIGDFLSDVPGLNPFLSVLFCVRMIAIRVVRSRQMFMNPFLNSQRQMRNGWWVLIFLCVLAAMLVPLIAISRGGASPGVGIQAAIVATASCICQLLRRRPISELSGQLDLRWTKQLLLGSLIGALLMLVPAAFLSAFGYVIWHWNGFGFANIIFALALWVGVSVVEELLFRGFIFQRMIAGLGEWPAQLVAAGFFVLIHSDAVASAGQQKYLAGANIFIASFMFGLAYIRTKSLAMPLGIHFAADLVQGTILGVGVSGAEESGLLRPVFVGSSNWMSGGAFGLEASVPGFVCVAAAAFIFYRWTPCANLNPPALPRVATEPTSRITPMDR